VRTALPPIPNRSGHKIPDATHAPALVFCSRGPKCQKTEFELSPAPSDADMHQANFQSGGKGALNGVGAN
jgi:hypothetical protein